MPRMSSISLSLRVIIPSSLHIVTRCCRFYMSKLEVITSSTLCNNPWLPHQAPTHPHTQLGILLFVFKLKPESFLSPSSQLSDGLIVLSSTVHVLSPHCCVVPQAGRYHHHWHHHLEVSYTAPFLPYTNLLYPQTEFGSWFHPFPLPSFKVKALSASWGIPSSLAANISLLFDQNSFPQHWLVPWLIRERT